MTMSSLKHIIHDVSIRKWEEDHKLLGLKTDSCRGGRRVLCKLTNVGVEVNDQMWCRISRRVQRHSNHQKRLIDLVG